ncbi:MAG TPA: Zn-ribbon domain-containing OB-fold protein [Rhizomicrobium sp.]|nr:Zn-ribbon domain-containing OB-fold protein [Rhizomicrobium sp.]
MSATGIAGLKPAVSFLRIEGDQAWLAGSKCGKCGTVFVGDRETCAKCFARAAMKPVKLADSGKLYNFTVVHRNFPGVPVPFISAIVDLDGGGTLKGNLLDVAPDPDKIKFDMPVKVVYRDAGRKDKEGNSYLAYFFVPAN